MTAQEQRRKISRNYASRQRAQLTDGYIIYTVMKRAKKNAPSREEVEYIRQRILCKRAGQRPPKIWTREYAAAYKRRWYLKQKARIYSDPVLLAQFRERCRVSRKRYTHRHPERVRARNLRLAPAKALWYQRQQDKLRADPIAHAAFKRHAAYLKKQAYWRDPVRARRISSEWAKRNRPKVNAWKQFGYWKNPERTRQATLKRFHTYCHDLADCYIRQTLGLNKASTPADLLEAKREHLRLFRLLKNTALST